MKRWILALALGVVVTAQSPAPVGTVTIVLADGTVARAQMVGFVVERDDSGFALRPDFPAATGAAQVTVTGEHPAPLTPGSPLNFVLQQLPAEGTLKLYRNGLRQSPVSDYAIQGKSITFSQRYADDVDPVIVADYQVQ